MEPGVATVSSAAVAAAAGSNSQPTRGLWDGSSSRASHQPGSQTTDAPCNIILHTSTSNASQLMDGDEKLHNQAGRSGRVSWPAGRTAVVRRPAECAM